jgi:hypothetical protein
MGESGKRGKGESGKLTWAKVESLPTTSTLLPVVLALDDLK